MNKEVSLSDLYAVIDEMLACGGTATFNPRGTSMLPTIHNDGDMVELKRFDKINKYDIPLYRREDGAFVLHRVVSVNKDGTYNMCGDNQWVIEKGIKASQIIGTVITIKRKGKTIKTDSFFYKIYVMIWVAIMPMRHLFIGGGRKLKRIIGGK